MLQEFRIDNFKSLLNIVFKPQGVNLPVGANDSGKTNLCQALRFVSRSTLHPLDDCVGELVVGRSGLVNFMLDKSTTDFYIRADLVDRRTSDQSKISTFEYELAISSPRDKSGDAAVKLEKEILRVTGGEFDDTLLLENVAGRARLLNEKGSMNGGPSHVETAVPADATMLQRLYGREANPQAICFRDYMVSWTYYDRSPNAMRGSAHKPREILARLRLGPTTHARRLFLARAFRERHTCRSLVPVVQRNCLQFRAVGKSASKTWLECTDRRRSRRLGTPDGGNLASVLYGLKTANEREYRKLLKIIRKNRSRYRPRLRPEHRSVSELVAAGYTPRQRAWTVPSAHAGDIAVS